jgi:CHRD domain
MRLSVAILLLAGAIGRAPDLGAQEPHSFKARLSPVPISVDMAARITGSGSVTAILTGTLLAVSGTFSGLQSRATVARIHSGERTGGRGPAVLELITTQAASGAISGVFDLTSAQLEALRRGRLYVQLHSDNAPEGNVWGWLLTAEGRR